MTGNFIKPPSYKNTLIKISTTRILSISIFRHIIKLMRRNEWLENLAKNLKKERKKLKISQQQLAERARLSITTITRIEQGNIKNPSFDTIEALGYALKKAYPFDLFKK
ncbi:MAG: helix-turn-helix transcriptional regulator [Halobacteriovoraceae bacterium]|nr:helix-turn-helix transcriptional regulator [Halobacteriovoraceae bacterium]